MDEHVTGLHCWQDRELRFDVAVSELQPRCGEIEIDSINAVEDTKGNNGEKGALSITNLRLIWVSHKNPRVNLSIGLGCCLSAKVDTLQSKLRGSIEGLCVMTKYKAARFEFLFTSLVEGSPRLFTSVQHVLRSFETTHLYRNVKLRGAIMDDKELVKLPDESVYQRVEGVWNLSSDQGNLGTFFITNIRLVWYANLAENFNVSIPYLQIDSLKIRDSKFGYALVVTTPARSGGYVLGFRIHPEEQLQKVCKFLTKLHELYRLKPVFGVNFRLEEQESTLEALKEPVEEDQLTISDTHHYDALSAYLADSQKTDSTSEPVFSPELGLAIEKLPPGYTINELWKVKVGQ